MNLEYRGIPESNLAVFMTAVTDTLDQLGLEYEFDEASPPDAAGEIEVKFVNIVPSQEPAK